ncbi:kelch repeat protein, partial [Teladorsagia circumcincta]
YDPQRNEWIEAEHLGAMRSGVSLSVLNGCLYVVGGFDGFLALKTVARLDPRVGRWEEVRPMTTRRQCLGTAVLDGNLFALGLAVANGKLYAVGGDDGVTDTVEVYDPKENQWRIHGSLIEGISLFEGTLHDRTSLILEHENESRRENKEKEMKIKKKGGGNESGPCQSANT